MVMERKTGQASRAQGPHQGEPDDNDLLPKGPPGLHGNPGPHAPHDPEDKPPGTVKPRSDDEAS